MAYTFNGRSGIVALRVEYFYDEKLLVTSCVICGRHAGGCSKLPVRFVLMDGDERIGDVCERCAYGPPRIWRELLRDHAQRLELQAAVLRSLATRVDDGEPAPEGIAEDLIRENAGRRGLTRPPLPPWLQHDD
jgi:hypothetical protein